MAEIFGGGPGLVAGVRLHQNAEFAFTVVGLVDQKDAAAEGADGHTGPAGKLDGGPALKLQPYLITLVDQRRVVAVHVQFDGEGGRVGNQNGDRIAGLEQFATGLSQQAKDGAGAGGEDGLRALAGDGDLHALHFGSGALDVAASGGEGGLGVVDLALIGGFDAVLVGLPGEDVALIGGEIGAEAVHVGGGGLVGLLAHLEVAGGGEPALDTELAAFEVLLGGEKIGFAGADLLFGGDAAGLGHVDAAGVSQQLVAAREVQLMEAAFERSDAEFGLIEALVDGDLFLLAAQEDERIIVHDFGYQIAGFYLGAFDDIPAADAALHGGVDVLTAVDRVEGDDAAPAGDGLHPGGESQGQHQEEHDQQEPGGQPAGEAGGADQLQRW